jgi:two-component system phosphate regulon response regulator PhoB
MRSVPHRVLIVEDDSDVRSLLVYNLEAIGYAVHAVETGRAGLAALTSFAPELVLLDLMLPDIPGEEVCRRIRSAAPSTPQPAIVILTAKGEEIDRIVGFELGANDYVAKPFSIREVVLRVGSWVRARGLRASSDSAAPRRRHVVGPLVMDLDVYEVRVGGVEVHLSTMEMRLLAHLAAAGQAGRCGRPHRNGGRSRVSPPRRARLGGGRRDDVNQ